MNRLELITKRIFTREAPELDRMLAFWHFKGYKIVFTNGCFDIVHLGHIDYLAKASQHGNVLIVGLNSDASVSRLKGNNRPLVDQHARAMVLASLRFVDAVVVFEEDTPLELIKKIRPDVLIKGADYKHDEIVGHHVVKEYGGKVSTIQLVEGYSTTAIEQKILAANKGIAL